MIGTYPTPVQLASELSSGRSRLWIKRDDLTGALYGGNKVRKLERILQEAQRRAARRIVTFGAAGSHHVLATTIYGSKAGFPVAAVLTPQPHSRHAENNLRTALSWGLEPWPCLSPIALPLVLARRWRRGDFVVPPGGSSLAGTLGYFDAARELAEQIRRAECPVPDLVIAALGSGGTAAGLLAGLASAGLPSRVVAVRIVSPVLAGPWRVASMAWRAVRHEGHAAGLRRLMDQLEVDGSYLGQGYGHPTDAGTAAALAAAGLGVELDATYTAKTFAAALGRVRSGASRDVLYWHTLSGACPAGPCAAQGLPSLSPSLAALLQPA